MPVVKGMNEQHSAWLLFKQNYRLFSLLVWRPSMKLVNDSTQKITELSDDYT